ncbi:MAG: NrdJb [Pseudomonadales bacterium]
MTTTINNQIVGFSVIADGGSQDKNQQLAEIVSLHEAISRPEILEGSTYKITTPTSPHALYVTMNDIVLNAGTEHETRRPFEVFINSKNLEHFQWVVVLTRVMSAVFRKGGEVTFLVDELKGVFDPKDGYFKEGRFIPSLVAEIGYIIEKHFKKIGLIVDEGMSEHNRKIIEEKTAQFQVEKNPNQTSETFNGNLHGAKMCNKCMSIAVIKMDGCMTCIACGESKCG